MEEPTPTRRSSMQSIGATGLSALTGISDASRDSTRSDTEAESSDTSLSYEGIVDVDESGDVSFGPEPDTIGKDRIFGNTGTGGIHEVDTETMNETGSTEVVDSSLRVSVSLLQQGNNPDSILFYDVWGGEQDQGVLKSASREDFQPEWERGVDGGVADIETHEGDAFVADGTAQTSRVYRLDADGNEVWDEKILWRV